MLFLILIVNDICLSVLEANPLNIDYASKEAQGKAFALNGIGISVGVIVGAGLFVSLIKAFSISTDYKTIFFLSGMIIVLFSLVTPFMIIEPPDLERKKLLAK